MSVEFNINSILDNDYTVYASMVVTLIYVFFRYNIEPFTYFVDSIYGKAILLFLIIWLLSEEHYTISICIIIIIITTLYWIRERRDYKLVKYTINTDNEVSTSGGKCSREGIRHSESEREVPGPKNKREFHKL